MKHQLGKITPHVTEKAIQDAEARLVKPEGTDGRPVYVNIAPQDIKERLELFQPRRPGYGTRTLDTKHVNALGTRIKRRGEIDPVLVVKFETVNPYTGEVDGHEWVVVDGHHRLAAYRKAKHTAPIRCQWFAGGVREAMDASVHRNEKVHLPIEQGDKHEAAWTRTVLDWDGEKWRTSKEYVVKLTGCGEGTVAEMRRMVKQHYNYRTGADKNPMGEKLYTRLGPDLSKYPWSKVNQVRLDLSPKQESMDDAAAKLSRSLNSRMPRLRTTDPEVTARALWLYDRELCLKLVEALQGVIEQQQKDERYLEANAGDEEAQGGGGLSPLTTAPEGS
jgi:ParB-like nuclease domain